jgi:RimJ/RimL family protein N-acetyltransferase
MKLQRINLASSNEVRALKRFYTANNAPGLFNVDQHPRPGTDYYAITKFDAIVGVTAVTPINSKLMKLHGTVITEKLRGKGIGKTMWTLLEKELMYLGVEKAKCEVYTDNYAQIMARLKAGFLIEGLMRDHEEVGKHEYVLGKRLV